MGNVEKKVELHLEALAESNYLIDSTFGFRWCFNIGIKGSTFG